MTQPSAQVLRNLGIPVTIGEAEMIVSKDERQSVDPKTGRVEVTDSYVSAYVPVKDGDEPKRKFAYVKFDHAGLAAIERYFGSLAAYNESAQQRPNEALAISMAIGLGMNTDDPETAKKISAILLADQTADYNTAVMSALSMANGVDPTVVARMVEEGRVATKLQKAQMNKEISEALDEAAKELAAEEERLAGEALEAEEEATTTGTDTPGPSGSESGPGSDETSTPSGD